MPTPSTSITELLRQWSEGDVQAPDRLMPLVYEELRRIATCCFHGERVDHTWQPTALLHESYLRLTRVRGRIWKNRIHFYSFAARVMRQTLVDHARQRGRKKRGGDRRRVPLMVHDSAERAAVPVLSALDDALFDLARRDSRKALIVELRFFGGLSIATIARGLAISPRTVDREWGTAKAFLFRALAAECGDEP